MFFLKEEQWEEVSKRATFHISEELLRGIKALAWWERRTIKNVVEEAIRGHFEARGADLKKAEDEWQKSRERSTEQGGSKWL